MKYSRFTTAIRGIITRVSRTPRTGVLVVGALILLGVGVMAGLTFASSQAVSATGTCRANPSYTLPSSLDLGSATNGVTVKDDGVNTYGVGGDSVGAVRSALDTCAPSFMGSNKTGEFLGYTSYTVNWSYDTQLLLDGMCRLENVKVGLHLSQLEPTLVGASSAAVQSKWASFSAALQTHENGHKAVDIAQANTLLEKLNAIHGSCAVVGAQAATTTNEALQDLITANANHDTVTDYGRDQGAVW